MPEHHPIFKAFTQSDKPAPEQFFTDFVGTMFRRAYMPLHTPRRIEVPDYPAFGEDYFGWISVLEAVADATDRFTIVELGGGTGQWSARAVTAAAQKGITDVRVCAVEADPVHVAWLRTTLEDNGLSAEQYEVIEAVVSNRNAETLFTVAGLEADEDALPENDYGQAKVDDGMEGVASRIVAADGPQPLCRYPEYWGKEAVLLRSGGQAIRVPQVNAADVISKYDLIDLIDMDVQGEEGKVISAAIRVMNEKVKRVQIGTHNSDVEQFIFSVMSGQGWVCNVNYPCMQTCETPYGMVSFNDGVQNWSNPRFLSR